MTRTLFQYHPTIGFHFVPGVRARVPHEAGGYLVRANSAGFRSDREFVAPKPPGTFRLLLFGDSYTAGDGVSNGQRYSDILETLLPGLEVFNYGLPGTGTDQHYLAWREVASSIEHDLLVIAVQVENIRRVVAHYREFEDRSGERRVLAKPYFSLDQGDGVLRLHNVPVPKDPIDPAKLGDEGQFVDRGGDFQLVRQAINSLGPAVKSLVQSAIGRDPLPAYARPDHPDWVLMKAILRRWTEESASPVIIMPLPLYHYVEGLALPDAYRARFAELAAPPHVTIHDPLPAFHSVPREARRGFRFARDVHPTPAAHRVLAESLAGALRPFVGRQPQTHT